MSNTQQNNLQVSFTTNEGTVTIKKDRSSIDLTRADLDFLANLQVILAPPQTFHQFTNQAIQAAGQCGLSSISGVIATRNEDNINGATA